VAGAFDLFVAYKFIKILTTPWEEQEAFALGIIDENGKFLRKSRSLKTREEKNSFTVFHRLIFNIKRLLEKTSIGKSKLFTFTAGLFLLKEGKHDTTFEDMDWTEFEDIDLNELEDQLPSFLEFITEDANVLRKGTYKLVNDVFADEEKIGKLGDIVTTPKNTKSIGELLGQPVFDVLHKKTKQFIKVSLEDIIEV